MKNFALIGVLTLSLAACGDKGDTGADRASDILALSGDATAGETLYTGNCSGCHGADGTGSESFPALTGVTADTTHVNIVIDGITGTSMPGFSTLSDQDIADIFAYIEANF